MGDVIYPNEILDILPPVFGMLGGGGFGKIFALMMPPPPLLPPPQSICASGTSTRHTQSLPSQITCFS